jgi:dolichyl-phosphate beta-glucosyltransferase
VPDALVLSLVIPAYNEAKRIAPSLKKAIAVLQEHVPLHEIIVVDDGSKDDTLQVATEATKDAYRFHGIRLKENLGKGGAVRAGMLAAKGHHVLFCDADESTPMETIVDFLPFMQQDCPVIIGTRKNESARIERHQSWFRENMGKGFTALAHLLAGVEVTDFTCGYKIFRHDAAQAIFSRQTLDDWSFDAEILCIAHCQNFEIQEVPVVWTNDEDTRVRLLKDTWDSFRGLLKVYSRRRRGLYSGHLPGESA